MPALPIEFDKSSAVVAATTRATRSPLGSTAENLLSFHAHLQAATEATRPTAKPSTSVHAPSTPADRSRDAAPAPRPASSSSSSSHADERPASVATTENRPAHDEDDRDDEPLDDATDTGGQDAANAALAQPSTPVAIEDAPADEANDESSLLAATEDVLSLESDATAAGGGHESTAALNAKNVGGEETNAAATNATTAVEPNAGAPTNVEGATDATLDATLDETLGETVATAPASGPIEASTVAVSEALIAQPAVTEATEAADVTIATDAAAKTGKKKSSPEKPTAAAGEKSTGDASSVTQASDGEDQTTEIEAPASGEKSTERAGKGATRSKKETAGATEDGERSANVTLPSSANETTTTTKSAADANAATGAATSAGDTASAAAGASAATPPSQATPGAELTAPVGLRLPAGLAAKKGDAAAHASGLTAADHSRFVQRVARAFQSAQDRDGEIRLRLSPPELGSLRLEIKVLDGVLQARMEAESPAARTLLLENLPALRERLAEQGIRVEKFDVELMNPQSQGGGGGTPGGDDRRSPQQGARPDVGRGTQERREASSEPAARPRTGGAGDARLNVIV